MDGFLARVEALAAGDPIAAERIRAARDSFAVIFIPGALGSKLTRFKGTPKEKVIWGSGSPEAKEIALKAEGTDPDVTPEVLDEFSVFFGFKREDIYGEYDRAIRQARNGRGVYLEFPYDWRGDIATNAQLLNHFLREASDVQGKAVIFVTHSMGGLVAWAWQNKYYQGSGTDPLRVRRLVLLGSPLLGTCEMARLLVHGYRPLPKAGKFETFVYKLLFADLRPAAFTFPSIFQLLPRVPVDSTESCLPVPLSDNPDDQLSANYFSADFWLTPLGEQIMGTPWAELGLDRAEFLERFGRAIGTAEQFRSGFDLNDLKIPVTFFYAEAHETTLRGRVTRVGQSYTIEFPFLGPGDGRVPVASAKNDGNNQGSRHFLRLSVTHGQLPKDPRFIGFIGTRLSQLVTAQVVVEEAKLLLANPTLLDRYLQRGGLMVSWRVVSQALGEEASEEVKSVITTLNERIRERVDPALKYKDLRLLQRKVDATDSRLNRNLVPALELVVADPEGVDDFNRTFALGRLGWALLAGGNPAAALGPLKEAESRLPAIPPKYERDPAVAKFKETLLSNLGIAHFRVGSCAEAERYLREAAAKGSRYAAAYIAQTCKDRETGEKKPLSSK